MNLVVTSSEMVVGRKNGILVACIISTKMMIATVIIDSSNFFLAVQKRMILLVTSVFECAFSSLFNLGGSRMINTLDSV